VLFLSYKYTLKQKHHLINDKEVRRGVRERARERQIERRRTERWRERKIFLGNILIFLVQSFGNKNIHLINVKDRRRRER
jgi:hypothetical protein